MCCLFCMQAMDADAELTKAIDEIVSIEWPAITQASDAQAVVGSGDRYVHVGSDEVPKDCWESNPAIRAWLREHQEVRNFTGLEEYCCGRRRLPGARFRARSR